MKNRQVQKWARFVITMSTLGAFGCGGPLRPSSTPSGFKGGDDQSEASSVILQLDTSGMHNFAAASATLRVGIWRVENDEATAQEGTDQLLNLGETGEILIKIGSTGRKEFRFALLDSSQAVRGTAKVRATVVPGVQRLPETVVIHVPRAGNQVDVSFSIMLNVNPGDTNRVVSYVDVKPIFDKSCASPMCHDSATNASDINLSTFPFKSATYEDSQTDIVDSSLQRMKNATAPMPPKRAGGLLDPKVVAIVQKWFDGGLQSDAGTNDPAALVKMIRFCWQESGSSDKTCKDLPRTGSSLLFRDTNSGFNPDKTYDFLVIGLGTDDVKLFESRVAAFPIPKTGKVDWTIEANIAEPKVTIPVVIIED